MKKLIIPFIVLFIVLSATTVLGQLGGKYPYKHCPGMNKKEVQQPQMYLVPVPPQYYYSPYYFAPPTIPPKPNFSTPLRDGAWYLGNEIDQMFWYNRYWRYKYLERKLGPPYRKPQPKRKNNKKK